VLDETPADGGTAGPGLIGTRQEFGRELTRLRERAGLTVRDVAKILGIPASTVGDYFGGSHLPPVKPPELMRGLLEACGVKEQDLIEEWLEALGRVRRAPGRRPGSAPVPYRGLAAFQPEDAAWFHGREKLTSVMVSRLSQQHLAGGMLVAVGASGSGKSSLLRAGLIPALGSGALGVPGSEKWPAMVLTPGSRPVQALAAHLAPLGLGRPARERTEPRPGGLVVVVDQFEEVFSACPDEAERESFITALCGLATGGRGADASGPVLVVLGLRADFYPHALAYPALVPALQAGQVLVGPMTENELRRVILEPARQAGLDVEDGLVELLLRDLMPAGSGPEAVAGNGGLPLLSHALLATYQRSRRRRLTVADYQGSGGIQGAVARSAEEAFGALTERQQDLARQVFIRLVHVADDTADTRRRVASSELPTGQGDTQQVLDVFIRQRLVTAETGAIQITHEALLTAWPRLRGWIDADRAGLATHRQLTIAAELWQRSGRDANALYRGGRLAAAGDWAADPPHGDDLNVLEREFLRASSEHQAAEERAARRSTRHLRQLVAGLTVLVVIAAVLTGLVFEQKRAATRQRDLAISQNVAASADQLRSTDVSLAMQLSLAAYQIDPTVQARASLLESWAGPAVTRLIGLPGPMQAVAVAPSGQVMAASGDYTGIKVWSLKTPGRPVPAGRPLAGHHGPVYALAFSPSGRILASGSGDHTVRLWNAADPRRIVPAGQPLTGPASTVYSVAFSPDGNFLAAGSADGRVWLWDLAHHGQPVSFGRRAAGPPGYVQAVAFSPDGRFLAAGRGDGTVQLWDTSRPGHPPEMGPQLRASDRAVLSVAFSPDGRLLAAGGENDQSWLWNVTDPRRPRRDGPPLAGPTSFINSLAFSPDGRSLAAGSSDSDVRIWDLATRQISEILPQPAPVTDVVFLRGRNDTVATAATDGIARLWRIPGPVISEPAGPLSQQDRQIFSIAFARSHELAVATAGNTARLWQTADPRHPVPLGPVIADASRSGRASGGDALSPDGRSLAIGAHDGNIQLWDVRDPAKPITLVQLHGPAQEIQSMSFSPDGRLLAAGSNDTRTWLWNVADPARPVLLAKLPTDPGNYVYSPMFSPDGRILAAGGVDKLVHLWNISRPDQAAPLARPLAGATSYVNSVAFSPDGRILAAGGADDLVRLWDITDPRRPVPAGQPLGGPANYVDSVAFSPDGRILAATDNDGLIWLWDVSRPAQPHLQATLPGSAGAIFADSYDPGRNNLATGGADGQVRFWNTSTRQVAAFVCSEAGDPITRTEWRTYIPGLPYRPPCHASPDGP
jgi:WD40 repeat protein/transcriptional regulator with XRE-family HTH domain